MSKLRVLDLFSGIGGFSLGLERTGGFETVAFCEIDPRAQAVLRAQWPGVPVLDDVTDADCFEVQADVITAGFPCQDISVAGKGAGLAGSRSGLFRHVVRAIRVVRPAIALLENVAALLNRGMGEVLGELAEVGYDAEWDCIPAAAVGLPHGRDRVWIAAYRDGLRELQPRWGIGDERGWIGDRREAVDWVLSRGGVLRSADGIPAGLDRIGLCGNAVVPQIPELIGRAILGADGRAAA